MRTVLSIPKHWQVIRGFSRASVFLIDNSLFRHKLFCIPWPVNLIKYINDMSESQYGGMNTLSWPKKRESKKTGECNRKTCKLKLLCKIVNVFIILLLLLLYTSYENILQNEYPRNFYNFKKVTTHSERFTCPVKLFLPHSKPSHICPIYILVLVHVH